MKTGSILGIFYAVLAAALYAVNAPFSKMLLNSAAPAITGSLLYLGAGLGVGIMYLLRFHKEKADERLTKEDAPYIAAIVLLNIAAQILLMFGIKLGTAANASLLGNFEIVATTAIAFLAFQEKVSARLWGAVALITLASMILSFSGEGTFAFSIGSLLVLGAAACWGLENNCTRKISGKSTFQVVTIKCLGAGTGALAIAKFLQEAVPGVSVILIMMLLGFVAYGLSIFCYIRAQYIVGAAKTSACYALAPFIGVLLSVLFVHETLTFVFAAAFLVMTAGTALIIRDTLSQEALS